MLHPSYSELMETINKENQKSGYIEIQSRYSVVIATAKRARELIDGDKKLVDSNGPKPLSVAVDEMQAGKLKLVRE